MRHPVPSGSRQRGKEIVNGKPLAHRDSLDLSESTPDHPYLDLINVAASNKAFAGKFHPERFDLNRQDFGVSGGPARERTTTASHSSASYAAIVGSKSQRMIRALIGRNYDRCDLRRFCRCPAN